MSTTTFSSAPTERVALRRLLWAGPLAIVAAIIANVVLYYIAVAAIGPLLVPTAPEGAVSAGIVAVATLMGTLGGWIVFALFVRFSKRPIYWYQIVAVVMLVLSLASPLTVGIPSTAVIVTLELMHILAAVISVVVMTRLTREA